MLYSIAYGLYYQGDYAAAVNCFRELVLSNALEESHWRGLASSHQMQGQFNDALHAWAIVTLLAKEDPYPHFHAAECLLSLSDKEESQKALNCAQALLREEHTDLQDKISVLRGLS